MNDAKFFSFSPPLPLFLSVSNQCQEFSGKRFLWPPYVEFGYLLVVITWCCGVINSHLATDFPGYEKQFLFITGGNLTFKKRKGFREEINILVTLV